MEKWKNGKNINKYGQHDSRLTTNIQELNTFSYILLNSDKIKYAMIILESKRRQIKKIFNNFYMLI